MTPSTELNHGRSCMQELDQFSHLMGWTFKDLDGGDDRDISGPEDKADLTQTAFGTTVEIPNDFVAPASSTSNKDKARQKATSSNTRIYRKRATRPTASSSAKTHPGDGNLGACSAKSRAKSPKRRTKRSSSKSDKSKEEPVDFVYDINVRRKLREQLDAERRRVLHEATARETRLRAQNKWVFDKREKSPPRRKQAWQSSSSPRKKSPTLDTAHLHVKSGAPHHSKRTASTSSQSSSTLRAASSSASSASFSTCHWSIPSASQRHHSTHRPTDDTDDVEISIRDFERRLQTHWGIHGDSP
ncbi:hypothetical protein PR003_g15370 [Phytophthora rubi]|uniref:Uncharacterized protein n=1 Tax=Phytophthora rubi TaxID=129364 RepID=A0A6A4EZX6_9STRA|nr:hypothetical protein PR003_g15370 [Phytophthora rubi]